MARTITLTENNLLKLLIRRGSNEERKQVTISQGELAYITDAKRVYVGDGSTLGGYVVGNRFYGSGTSTPVNSLTPSSSITNGFAAIGDTYFNTDNNTFYVLTGTNVTNLSAYQRVANICFGDEIEVTRAANGSLSLLPLSATSFDSKIFLNGITSSGVYLTLGTTLSTNKIVPQSGTSITLSASVTNYLQIGSSDLNIAPASITTLNVPRKISFGASAPVTFPTSNWDGAPGYVYKDGANNFSLRSVPTSYINYLSAPQDILERVTYQKVVTIEAGVSSFQFDVTALSGSGLMRTVSGVPGGGALIINGIIADSGPTGKYTAIWFDTDAYGGTTAPIQIYAIDEIAAGTTQFRRLYNVTVPLSSPSGFAYSIGTLTLNVSANNLTTTTFTMSVIGYI